MSDIHVGVLYKGKKKRKYFQVANACVYVLHHNKIQIELDDGFTWIKSDIFIIS